MSKVDFIELSKIVSHALRHEPQSYGLKLDNEGWVLLFDLVSALNLTGVQVDEKTFFEMVEHSKKKRHQVLNNKIRAYYGHSVKEKIIKQGSEPPDLLYHGTIKNNLISIKKRGLITMNRQYVHLSANEETAKTVGRRKQGELVIIKVKAKEAYNNYICFYKEENDIWLSDPIPSKYIMF